MDESIVYYRGKPFIKYKQCIVVYQFYIEKEGEAPTVCLMTWPEPFPTLDAANDWIKRFLGYSPLHNAFIYFKDAFKPWKAPGPSDTEVEAMMNLCLQKPT